MSHNLAWYHPHDRLRLHRATYIDLTRMKSVVKKHQSELGWRGAKWLEGVSVQTQAPLRLTFIFDPTVLLSLVYNDIKKKAIPAQGTGVRQPWECYALQNLFNWHIYYIQHCVLTRELLVRTQRVGVGISTWSFKSQQETRVFPSQLLQL